MVVCVWARTLSVDLNLALNLSCPSSVPVAHTCGVDPHGFVSSLARGSVGVVELVILMAHSALVYVGQARSASCRRSPRVACSH